MLDKLFQQKLRELEKERCERKLEYFVERAWKALMPGVEYKKGWHVGAICEHLEAVTYGEIRHLIINIPPRHTKSFLVSVFWPAWEWIHKPGLHFLTSSYALMLSIRDNVRMRRLVQGEWYQSHWADRYQITTDQNEKMKFENTEGGQRMATSVGGVGTGEGGDRIIVDDPHNVNEAESDLKRMGVWTWWDETMSTRLNDPSTGCYVIIMQRVHEDDLTGHLLDLQSSLYTHLCIPFRYEGQKYISMCNGAPSKLGTVDRREKVGEILDPGRWPEEAARELESRMTEYARAAQLQQRPVPREGGVFKRHWWRFWQWPGQDLPPVKVFMGDGSIFECPVEDLPVDMSWNEEREESEVDWWGLEVVQSWDMTFKDSKDSDFVVGEVWAKRRLGGAEVYLLDEARGQWNFPDTVRKVLELKRNWPMTERVWVEDKANGPAVISTLRSEIPGLIPVTPKGDKVSRANAVTYLAESGCVYLPHPENAPWVRGWIDEVSSFPKAKRDDRVDAMTQALLKLQKRGVTITTQRHWLAGLRKPGLRPGKPTVRLRRAYLE